MQNAQCMKDLEIYGLTTSNILRQLLTTCDDPIEAIKAFQIKNGLQLNSLKPALKILDLHGVRRAELHEALLNDLSEKMIAKVRFLGAKHTPDSVLSLQQQLDRCFKLYKQPRIRPIVLETLKQLSVIGDRYLRLIVCDTELYKSCDVCVRRQIWVKNSEFFLKDITPVIDSYLEEKEKLLLSIEHSFINFFTRDTTRTRSQWPQIRELVKMIGDEELLYTLLIDEIRSRFLQSKNCHLCSLRMELLMAIHESDVDFAIRVGKLILQQYKLITTYFMTRNITCFDDRSVRDKHWDAQQTAKLRTILDTCRKELSKAIGDMAMFAHDPHVVHFLSLMAVKILRDNANACSHLPREHPALYLILKLLYLGTNVVNVLNEEFPAQLVPVDCVTRFLPSFVYLITENLMKYDLQRASDDIADEYFAELLVDEESMQLVSDHLRADEVCALLWYHYLLDIMPSKRRFLNRGGLYRYIQYLPVLANRIGSADPWIHLFIHRLIHSNTTDSLISDEAIARKIVHSVLIDEVKTKYNCKFHLLRLCMHLKTSINEELLRDCHDALAMLYDEVQLQRNTFLVADESETHEKDTKMHKWDDYFLLELEKYQETLPGATLVVSSTYTLNFPVSSSLSAEAVAAATLGD